MNLQYERMLALCDSLNLPFVAQNYLGAAQEAAAVVGPLPFGPTARPPGGPTTAIKPHWGVSVFNRC